MTAAYCEDFAGIKEADARRLWKGALLGLAVGQARGVTNCSALAG
ncbi:hypothetical protein ACFXEL_20940 [Streptomyces sp. NPDC059382]